MAGTQYIPWALLISLGGTFTVLATDHRRANLVPPSQELEILDPRVDPEGRPRPEIRRKEDGTLEVDIPETVIVHKYYYTGERSFQAGFIKGGPVILVFQHPKRAERMYIPAVLPAGAPVVHYFAHGIEYRYPDQKVCVTVGHFGKAHVQYHTGKTVHDVAKTAGEHVHKTASHLVARTGVNEAVRKAGETTKNVGLNVVDKGSDLVKGAATPVIKVISSLPLVKPLTSQAESYEERTREAGVRRALDLTDKAQETVRTIR